MAFRGILLKEHTAEQFTGPRFQAQHPRNIEVFNHIREDLSGGIFKRRGSSHLSTRAADAFLRCAVSISGGQPIISLQLGRLGGPQSRLAQYRRR
jgi:hypothetical protein